MGLGAKRVPLEFDWPPGKGWPGSENPHNHRSHACEACTGYPGFSPTMRHLRDQWLGLAPFNPQERGSVPFCPDDAVILDVIERKHSVACQSGSAPDSPYRSAAELCAHVNARWQYHLGDQDVAALIERGGLLELTHVWASGEHAPQPIVPAYVPEARTVNEATLRTGRKDPSECFSLSVAECEQVGNPVQCPVCHGAGRLWPTDLEKTASLAWLPEEPPTGPGYQMWDGLKYPVSPVFDDARLLGSWMAAHQSQFPGICEMTATGWCRLISLESEVPSFLLKKVR
jgi:hypothetical protein